MAFIDLFMCKIGFYLLKQWHPGTLNWLQLFRYHFTFISFPMFFQCIILSGNMNFFYRAQGIIVTILLWRHSSVAWEWGCQISRERCTIRFNARSYRLFIGHQDDIKMFDANGMFHKRLSLLRLEMCSLYSCVPQNPLSLEQ